MKNSLLTVRFFMVILATIFTFAHFANAQSGRRTNLPRPTPTPTPVPETIPTSQADQTSENIKVTFTFKVVQNTQFTIYNQIVYPENIQRRVVERLRKSLLPAVELRGESNRKKAIEMAKESEDTHVILLTLSEEEFMNPQKDTNMGKLRIGRVWVNFDVFEPKTGKSLSSGTTYLDFDRRRSVLEKTQKKKCYPTAASEEDLVLLEAGDEIATRIMSRFNIPISPVCK